ncbi:hypothetical protein THRCLA_23264 [Thraustotheca clavata]|uniref:Uncharacterized protein n=1 Tax=Thraustotheca clavata TaxID=74557 RepID=A0A1V9Y8A3_9STRA|nr:hypothetical protein THRCLA_23264 [Thraustotheca clavata]
MLTEDDGGDALHRLWELWKWKMIPSCPGRYIVKKNRDIVSLSLEKLVEPLGFEIVVNENSLQNPIESTDSDHPIWIVHTNSPVIADPVHVAIFPRGGGVITYIKPTGDHVHTLNTQSGLIRKLTGLRLISTKTTSE